MVERYIKTLRYVDGRQLMRLALSLGCCNEVSPEACTALQEVADAVCQVGTLITYIKRGELDVSRDNLNAIKKRSLSPDSRYNFKAYPIDRQPNLKKLTNAGIKEDVDTIVYIPVQYFIDAGLWNLTTIGEDFSKIETIRSTVILDGSEWAIKDKGLSGRVNGVPLYITFGLHQK